MLFRSDGLPVFSGKELERLRPLLGSMEDAERERAVGQICDVKAVLGGYVTETRA